MTKVPGLDTPAALASTGACRSPTSLARSTRSSRSSSSTRARCSRQLIWAELDSNASTAGQHRAPDPPGQEPARGRALHRRPAQPARGRRDAAPAEHGLPPLPRPHQDRLAGLRAAPAAHGADLQAARAGGHRAQRPLRGLGLHRRERAHAVLPDARTSATTPSRGLGDTNLGDLKVSGALAEVQGQQGHDFTPCGTDGCQTGEDDVIQRRVEGTVEVPCYLDQPGCPAGSRFKLGADGHAGAHAGQRLRTPTSSATSRARSPRPRPGGSRSTATGCSAARARSTASAASRSRAEHRVVLCATDWIGMSGGDVPNTITILQDLSRFPDARRPPPAGHPRLPLPRARDDPPEAASRRAWPSGTARAR